ncbi:prolipoprotein diacylglyceryl transferase family protein [Rubrivirga litoralis]|uniref:Prolipoprotein diacylglyceryl transferase n=1 Tax=Rubrivirga litoralis TaxID=3075598 RepID=A0ABU3BPK6_9BACT|nr:prolipoprotein diacylglyceryl transferase family protein [Rubrivirga sp. F394]MDT0631146.1 prolipoprotein diacylglyceryl transferase [Rubrivirga sp. F394]
MDLTSLFGAHPEWFGPFTVLAFGAAYLTAVVVGYRRGWPPAAWLLVLAAAGIGGVVGTRLLPLGLDGLRALWLDGALPDAGVRRLPGTIAGALVAAEAARRLLGVRRSMLDPLASAGLVGIAVARVGCLLAGCCFGTPTDGPWGVTYAAGSFVHGFHLAHGVVEGGAAGPAPVHPIPLYDIAFALVVLALLPRLARRLRAPGSLCGAVVGLYAVHRFAQDFVRANDVTAWGGLTAVQVGMAAAAALALGAVLWAERRERGGAAESWGGADRAEPAPLRLVAVLGVVVALRLALDGWLTSAEAAVLLIRIVPAAGAVAVALVRSPAAAPLRWAAAGVAGALPLVAGFQTEPAAEPFSLWAVEAHGDVGRYQEFDICSDNLYQYTTAGAGVARVWVDPEAERTREVGVRVYGGRQAFSPRSDQAPRSEEAHGFAAVAPYARVDERNIGGSLGLHVGRSSILGPETATVFPSAGLRLGPRRAHFLVGFMDAPHFGAPAPAVHIGAGTGRLTADGQELRVTGGVSGSGFYVAGTIPAGRLFLEPMGAVASSNGDWIYQGGVRLRLHLPAE